MVANRMIAGSGRVENNHSEIIGAVGGHHKTPTELEVATIGVDDLIFHMTAQAEVVANLAEQLRLVSPMGKMATLATEPFNSSVGNSPRTLGLVFVTGQADTATHRAQ